MAVEIDGVFYKTIQEAARELGTTDKTLREWIDNGTVSPEPPETGNGLRSRRYFPDELLKRYKQQIAAIREERNRKRKERKKAKRERQRRRKP